jgi:hypothetical protein
MFSRQNKKLARQVDDSLPDLDDINGALRESLQKKINKRAAPEADHEDRPGIIHKEQRTHHRLAVIFDGHIGPVQPDAALEDSIAKIERPQIPIVGYNDFPVCVPETTGYRTFDVFLTYQSSTFHGHDIAANQ